MLEEQLADPLDRGAPLKSRIEFDDRVLARAPMTSGILYARLAEQLRDGIVELALVLQRWNAGTRSSDDQFERRFAFGFRLRRPRAVVGKGKIELAIRGERRSISTSSSVRPSRSLSDGGECCPGGCCISVSFI